MKPRTTILIVAFCVFAIVVGVAQNPNVGTWKLNESKSKIPAGVGKNTQVVYTPDGDNLKAVIDGVDGKGNPTHSEWTGKFDGKDYPVTGDPNTDTRAIATAGANSYKIVSKKGGKQTMTGTVVTSADGKTRTVTTRGKDPKGKPVSATYVYDKQ